MPSTVVAELRDITIAFPGVKALDGVDLVLRAGEIHALMGENGAGKSTLIKALTGVYAIDSGTVEVGGRPRRFSGTADAQAAGIATVYQEVNLCTNLSVGENVMLGREVRGRLGIDWSATHRAARTALELLGLQIDTRTSLSSHSIAVQQLIAIARATVLESAVLVLDEPTSSLDRSEVEQLFAVVRRMRDTGVAVLFVTHFLDQVYELCDRITVLRNGRRVGEFPTAELPRRELVSTMLGRELARLEAIEDRALAVGAADSTVPVLRVEDLGRKGVIAGASLELRPGEIVGLAGLLGSGRTELARLLYGADRPDAGHAEVHGRPARLSSPRAALAHRIAFSSEDRRSEGIIPDLSVRENLVLAVQAQRGWARPLSRTQQDAIVERYMTSLGVQPPMPARSSATCRAATSRRCSWAAGSPRIPSSSSWTSPPAASTSVRRRRSSVRSRTSRPAASRCCSSRRSSRRSCASRSASTCCKTGISSPKSSTRRTSTWMTSSP
ncbi:sugar ABC transporter ATP-binding protein [Pseudolysinimonas kribbensis]|uniref:Sugar ABC transporter ATP-binding protein n=1 Tax=Pseudolysinimonas kribbensis TaxID=433641 RepID=A0ABQ6K7G8_9MICO|nr:sugar ABC transporter ATP-binding protein [Pseudolysinimonas kribbensis]